MKTILLILFISIEIFAGTEMCGSGRVVRLLSDDNQGNRHQKFIIKESSGRTLLIAHNIDLAQKIYSLNTGDLIKFCGEYENNAKGGVVHWTHHDPQQRHTAGWLEHNGKRYE